MNSLPIEQLKEFFESSEIQEVIREKNQQYCLVEYIIIGSMGPFIPGIMVKMDRFKYALFDERGSIGIIGPEALCLGRINMCSFYVRPRMLVKLENGEWTYTSISFEEFEL